MCVYVTHLLSDDAREVGGHVELHVHSRSVHLHSQFLYILRPHFLRSSPKYQPVE